MARGRNEIVSDEDGKQYIDFVSGIGVGSIGHCHPHYIEALKKQLEELTFGSFATEVRMKFLRLLALPVAAAAEPHPTFFRRCRSGRGCFQIGKIGDQEIRICRLLGRIFMARPAGSLVCLGMNSRKTTVHSCPGSISPRLRIATGVR